MDSMSKSTKVDCLPPGVRLSTAEFVQNRPSFLCDPQCRQHESRNGFAMFLQELLVLPDDGHVSGSFKAWWTEIEWQSPCLMQGMLYGCTP